MLRRLLLAAILLTGTAHAQIGPAPAFPHPDGSDCNAGNFPRGMDEEGNAQLCTAISAVGGAIVVEENDNGLIPLATGIDFLGADFNVSEGPVGEANISLAVPHLPLIGGVLDAPGNLSIDGRLLLSATSVSAVVKFSEGDSTPDVSGASFFRTADNAVNITDFDWTASDPTEYGQLIFIRSVGKTTYQCAESGNKLDCGTRNIPTFDGYSTLWVSLERESGGGLPRWRLVAIFNPNQAYDDILLRATSPQTFGTTTLNDTQLRGYFDLGFARYFNEGDTTPGVSEGTLWYSFVCNDDYNAHCADLYNSASGGPCGDGDVQCSGIPDGNCDFDGLSAITQAPQRSPPIEENLIFSQDTVGGTVIVKDKNTDVDPSVDTVRIDGTTDYDGTYTGANLLALTGSIQAVADVTSPPVQITTSAAHFMANGDSVVITGTSSYNGTWSISNVTATTFEIQDVFGGNEIGVWTSADHFKINDTWTNDQTPHNASFAEIDGLCDADATSSFPNPTSSVTVTDIDGGVDGQIVYVVTRTDEGCVDATGTGGVGPPDGLCDSDDTTPLNHLIYDCTTVCTDSFNILCVDTTPADGLCDSDGTSPSGITQETGSSDGRCDDDKDQLVANTPRMVCGTVDVGTLTDYTAAWAYDGITRQWRLLALETFSDVVKASLRSDNTLTGKNTFEGALSSGAFGVASADLLDVSGNNNFILGGSFWTLTNMTGGTEGQSVVLISTGSLGVKLDCTGSNLKCGNTDINVTNEDAFRFTLRGTIWYMNGSEQKSTNYNADHAPIPSPAFTGDPTGPTPASGDSDTSLATTAYVQGEVGTHPIAAGDYVANSIDAGDVAASLDTRTGFQVAFLAPNPVNDELVVMLPPFAGTMTQVRCEVFGGTNVVINICDGEDIGDDTCATSILDPTASTTLTCTAAGAVDSALNATGFVAYDKLSIVLVSESGSVKQLSIMLTVTVD